MKAHETLTSGGSRASQPPADEESRESRIQGFFDQLGLSTDLERSQMLFKNLQRLGESAQSRLRLVPRVAGGSSCDLD